MEKTKNPRVRFAPSPTGFLHIGAIRSALFNYLFAKGSGGTFLLRLEDTDRERHVPEAEQHLLKSLAWLGLSPDEGFGTDSGECGPYVQSKRLDIYTRHAQDLTEKNTLYPCWCSPERLTKLREAAAASHTAFKYDRYCLKHLKSENDPHVLRFKIPDGQTVGWQDAVRGDLEFKTDDLDDFVCLKSDGYPTYQFANVVDDHLMHISHVLRADEWIPSTPKHVLLYQAFSWQPPIFAHLPAVLAPGGGKKLSKRHGAKSALELRDEGYLPEAIINFLALLGWNPGDGSTKEVFHLDELIAQFSLGRIQKSPAVFDIERLNWLNGVHIRHMALPELLKRAENFMPPSAAQTSQTYRLQALKLVQERLKTLAELPELTDFFFEDPEYHAVAWPGENTSQYLQAAHAAISRLDQFSHDGIESALRSLANDLGAKSGDLFKPLRLALTGKTAAPGLFETMVVLGQKTVLRRLNQAIHACSGSF